MTVTAFSWGARIAWPLDLLTHLRPQYAIGFAVLTGLCGLLRDRNAALIGLAGVVVNGLPAALLYVSPDPAPAPEGATLRVVTINVFSANRTPEAVLEFIRAENPDVLFLQEVTPYWNERIEEIRRSYPHVLSCPREDNFGVALYSRIPIADSRILNFSEAGIPSVYAVLDTPSGPLHFIGTHPVPPVSGRNTRLRNDQLGRAAEFARALSGAILLAGDLNVTSDSPVFGDLREASGLRDSRRGFGVQATWPAPSPVRIPIDHALHSDGVHIRDRRVGPPVGSDHLPVILDITISP